MVGRPEADPVNCVAVIPFGLFLIGLLFLVAGLLIQVESVVPTALPANPYDA